MISKLITAQTTQQVSLKIPHLWARQLKMPNFKTAVLVPNISSNKSASLVELVFWTIKQGFQV